MPHAIYGDINRIVAPTTMPSTTVPVTYTNQVTTILQQLNTSKNKKTAKERLTLIVEELAILQERAEAAAGQTSGR
jgi:hypothetical protein